MTAARLRGEQVFADITPVRDAGPLGRVEDFFHDC